MNQNIAVVGAGICGLCTGLALAVKGNTVTIYERDIEPPKGGADQAFFEWNRRGAAQFRHPHAFLAVMCNMLEKNYPDLIEQFLAAGARKLSFSDMLPFALVLHTHYLLNTSLPQTVLRFNHMRPVVAFIAQMAVTHGLPKTKCFIAKPKRNSFANKFGF